jgi:hypothetical protein
VEIDDCKSKIFNFQPAIFNFHFRMNYFAHGHRFVDRPYFLAGTAVPDWLNVVDRRARARDRRAALFVEDDDPRVAALARGVCQHHADDAWFHQTRAFAELSLDFARRIRDLAPADQGMRPSFLGHILVELLLDAELIAEAPERLGDYYRAVDQLDPQLVERTVGAMAAREVNLAAWIPLFSSERFLSDYREDAKLCFRLNQVLRRVGLPALPEAFAEILPPARRLVRRRMSELLTP